MDDEMKMIAADPKQQMVRPRQCNDLKNFYRISNGHPGNAPRLQKKNKKREKWDRNRPAK